MQESPLLNQPVIVDTHCHLDFANFEVDRVEVVERALQSGVARILNPGVDLPSSQAALRLAATYSQVYAAAGVHPNDSLSWNAETLSALRELASPQKAGQQRKVVAIGEIGLDYYRDHAPRSHQRQVFQAQLELAAELQLPVVIHCRQAMNDLLSMLADWHAWLESNHSLLALRPGVLHSFSGDEDAAQRAIGMSFMIGISGPITFRNAIKLQDLAAHLPISHLLIETDAPFLAPHPYRAQRNEPAYVRLVAEKIASLQNQPYAKVAEATTANAGRLFLW